MSAATVEGDPFAGFELEQRIVARARSAGIEASAEVVARLAAHARAVLAANPTLKLTTIVAPEEFLERHIGESLEGAAMLDPAVDGRLIDLGSGNGFPGLAVAAARPGLTPLLVEVSERKAAFLRETLGQTLERGNVLQAQVQRPADLGEGVTARVLTVRAVGGWERLLPRLRACLAPEGDLLLWAGADVERVSARAAWRALRLAERRALPGRDSSWIWRFRRVAGSS